MSVFLSSVEGNTQKLDGGSMFGNAPRPVWEKWLPPDDKGRIPLACRSMLVECDGKKILCETGIGAFFEPKMAERYGVQTPERHLLLESLAALKIKEEDIDAVVLSHLHFDHAGGLLPAYQDIAAGRDTLLFPKARYLVGREAWARALKPHARDQASFIPGLTDKLQKSGRLTIVDGDHVPGFLDRRLSFRLSSGHTPGQMHAVFHGDKHTVIFAGDLIPGMPWVHLPITMGYDRYPEQLIDEKAELYKSVVPEHWLVFYTHDTKAAASFVKKNEQGRYEPEAPITTLKHFAI